MTLCERCHDREGVERAPPFQGAVLCGKCVEYLQPLADDWVRERERKSRRPDAVTVGEDETFEVALLDSVQDEFVESQVDDIAEYTSVRVFERV